ncbi:hypothetical protein TSAR_004723 [Trichomalopsis sarcophagae]|uniref:Uncharacterized protein n=1 Tax=Trichomalopsis sarcophagae TaxID=543379 RepID=A0A232FLA8_9HYME|nr:hypothetical protein TSAR_004723 [Trichomalopsis sarcophagae]
MTDGLVSCGKEKQKGIKMNQDYSKAVSFTNSYFALADGLVTGLENCLAENVVLDWFGKTIKGRTNVAAFMNKHKVHSRHVFNDISPTDSIGYNKKPTRRSRRRTSRKSKSFLNSSGNIVIENRLNSITTPENETVSNGDRSRSSRKMDSEGNHVEESDITIELHDDDVSTLFKRENIKSTNVEEIEAKISQISLEDKLKKKSPKKREYEEVDGRGNISVLESSMKYVEAHGEILFSKKSRRQSDWSECKLILSSSTHTWRKPSKLQIAYSSQRISLPQMRSSNNNTIQLESSSSLDQVNELCNNLIPNSNKFGGYLRNINRANEEDAFFKSLDEHLSRNEANKLGLSPKNFNGQLVFQKTNCDDEEDSLGSFIFNHLIHVIIYEGRSRCRMNLSQKFI